MMSLLRIGLVLLMLWNDGKRPEVSNNDSRFRVATYNIRYATQADEQSGNGWDLRKDALVKVITTHGFDIIGTQEGSERQLADMKQRLVGFDYLAHSYGVVSANQHNCAIFYRTALFEVLDSGVFWLSPTPDVQSVGWDASDHRIGQWIRFRVKETGREFYFFNTHFYWRLKEARAESGPLLARKIREIAGDTPVICTGDFNSAPGSPQVTAVKEVLNDARDITQKPVEGVEETAFSGGVFQGAPKYRIDFIFLSRHFKAGDYKVLSDMYNGDRYPSDHLPVTSMVTF